MQIPHADLPNLTIEMVQADLDRRLKESLGTVVSYDHHMVQALIVMIEKLSQSAVHAVNALDGINMSLTSKADGRASVEAQLATIRENLARHVEIKPLPDSDW